VFGIWCNWAIGGGTCLSTVSSFRGWEVGWDCGSSSGSYLVICGCGSISVGIWCDCGIGDGTRSSMVSSFRGQEVGWDCGPRDRSCPVMV